MNMDDSLCSKNCNQQVEESVICDAKAISYSSFETCADSKVSYADEDKISWSDPNPLFMLMGFEENIAIKENPLFRFQDSHLGNENLSYFSLLTNAEILMEGGQVEVSLQPAENSIEKPCGDLIYEEEEIIDTFLSSLKLDDSSNGELNICSNQIKD